MSDVVNQLSVILADTYALYLKTQNYHWHVRGPQFISLHQLFETHYRELAEAVDGIAERIVILGFKAPATFKDLEHLKSLKDGDSHGSSNDMLQELAQDHGILLREIKKAIMGAQKSNDEGTVSLLSDRISAHEKAHWMLTAFFE